MSTIGFASHDHSSCIHSSIAAIEAHCAEARLQLTPVRRRVLEILLERHRAMGAYDILEVLSAEGIPVNATINFTPLQALLAAKAGAAYISPFLGRLDSAGQTGVELAEQIRTIYDNYGFETKLLTAAIRHPDHVLQSALIGADACTMAFSILEELYNHHLTDVVLDKFLEDWKDVPKWKGGPYGD